MLPTTLTSLLVTLLNYTLRRQEPIGNPAPRNILQFELRHLHAVSSAAHVIFSDVTSTSLFRLSSGNGSDIQTRYSVQTRPVTLFRPPSFIAFSQARIRSLTLGQSERIDWQERELLGPDTESRETLLELAKMTNNAYVDPEDGEWYELSEKWNNYPFGWEPDADGIRGHVFATVDNSTVIVSIKGTSVGLFSGGGPTEKKDKINDNLLFSCCCARVDWTWTTVCGCYRGGWKCDQSCLEHALIEDSLFYPIGTNLYNNLTYMYPEAEIWITGHSLGGSLGGLLGATFGAPVIAFETPGERLAATRLHLPSPPSTHHIIHVYHTADPIAMGTCNGVLSSCALKGYAMETKCHLGKSILYDTVSNLSWAVDIRTHGIVKVIEDLLSNPWPPSVEVGREVPEAQADEEDCASQECYSWEFADYPT